MLFPEGTDMSLCKQSKQDEFAPQTEKKTAICLASMLPRRKSSSLPYGYDMGMFQRQNDTC
ncbi:hypothetical protein M513_13489 [Trichuris suis]|uniref:Uncharacterized protein n=1 Tax=Trichuris suis TaxID=68888 RepID=A0A085LKY4_9BILA|nr:hypothetical protein M513_13489 [Trichuris suis]